MNDTKRFEAMIGCSDVVIAANDFLAQSARQYTDGSRVVMIPTCVETKAYERELLSKGPTFSCDAMVLVWIASSSTLPLLADQSAILDRMDRKVFPIRLKVICDAFPDLQHMLVQAVPWSIETEIRELASSHVGVSWLPKDDWGQGKCGLKVLQYMDSGLPVVANPFGVHLEMIEHGQSGFLAEMPEGWLRAVAAFRIDPALAKRTGQRGKEIVRERYSVFRWAPRLYDALTG